MPEDCSELCGRNAIIQHSSEPAAGAFAVVDRGEIIPAQAQTDAQLIDLWVHRRSPHTVRAYRADAQKFLRHVGKPLHSVTLGDIQAFADALDSPERATASRNRILAAIKSLFAFGHRLGYLPFDVARVLRLSPLRDALAERILSEAEVKRMIMLEPNLRNQTLLTTLYASGCRVSEIAGLRWRDFEPRGDGGQVTVFGKGGKTRAILLPQSVVQSMTTLRQGRGEDMPVFVSRKRQPLSPSQILRIAKRAGRRAGLQKNCVAHTFRHCHASHSLERGAPIHLVQATLGHSSVATTGRYLHARPSDSSSRYLPL